MTYKQGDLVYCRDLEKCGVVVKTFEDNTVMVFTDDQQILHYQQGEKDLTKRSKL